MNSKDFITSINDLKDYLKNKGHKLDKSIFVKINTFPILLTKYYANLIDWTNINDPLMKMVLPSSLENITKPYELIDPVGDNLKSPIAGLVHRHTNRCLVLVSNQCAVHCRFCFRKNRLPIIFNLNKIIDYIQKHKELWEVILSGGDPFMLTNTRLRKLINSLKKIKHIKVIRIHTHIPTVFPKRINNGLLEIIKVNKPIVIVIHINHPNEITKEFRYAVKKLISSKAMVLSQSVLLRGVNNNPNILEKLFKNLIILGIKPYYLHHLDLVPGTSHFRISLEEGKAIMKILRQNISGICMPEYILDNPEGKTKIPVFWFNKKKNKYYYEGLRNKISYRDNI